jgi:hypothetical protein
MKLGLPPGHYTVSVRQEELGHSCPVVLSEGADFVLETRHCQAVTLVRENRKGAPARIDRWGLELGLGMGTHHDDLYTTWFDGFRFGKNSPFRPRVALSRDLTEHFTLLLDVERLESRTYWMSGSASTSPDRFGWDTYGVGAFFRTNFRFLSDRLVPYLQLGGGVGWSRVRMVSEGEERRVTDWGFFLGTAAGLQTMLHPNLGLFLQAEYQVAPVSRTLNDQGGWTRPHDSGGLTGMLGLRVQL